MAELVTWWAVDFRELYPDVDPAVDAKGSALGVFALIERSADVAPMARPMSPKEIEAFVASRGYEPVSVEVALDAVAIYVNAQNPIPTLSLQDLDAAFSSARKSGAQVDAATWGQLGLTGEWVSTPITLYGPARTSGSSGFFKERALVKGELKPTVREQPSSVAVVQALDVDRGGIGYAPVGFATREVRVVPLVGGDGRTVEPTERNVHLGAYPLSRPLYLYVDRPPGRGLAPHVREFLVYATSRQGEVAVRKAGFMPITSATAVHERMKIE